MKKILMIGPFGKPVTGMSIANEMLYKHLKELDRVINVNTVFEKEINNKNEQGRFSAKKFFWTIKNTKHQINTCIDNDVEIVYITPGQSLLGLIRFFPIIELAKCDSKKIYLHFHGSKFREMYDSKNIIIRRIIKYYLNKSNAIIVLGTSLIHMFEDIVDYKKIRICENGVQKHVAGREPSIAKKDNDSKLQILFLSNLMEDKGVLNLLKASEFFKEDIAHFHLAGEIEPQIKSQIEKYIEDYPRKISYHGFVDGDKKKKLLEKCSIYVLPSKDEGQPISILEAYSNSCAVITDESVGGISDIFTDGVNGISCDHSNYMSTVNSINIMKNSNVYGITNYNKYQMMYSEKKFVERLIGIFNYD